MASRHQKPEEVSDGNGLTSASEALLRKRLAQIEVLAADGRLSYHGNTDAMKIVALRAALKNRLNPRTVQDLDAEAEMVMALIDSSGFDWLRDEIEARVG
jgi:hypothetical protein